jgi:WYL domain
VARTADANPDIGGAKSAPWGQERRLEFIDFRLQWEGRVNRSDIVDFFGISIPQASLDFARYFKIAPHNARYDHAAKSYVATSKFSPIAVPASSERYLNEVFGLLSGTVPRELSYLGWMPPVDTAQFPVRQVRGSLLRRVLRAIRGRRALTVDYQSMSRPEPARRTLSPHAIAYDGFRWHMRAFCHQHRDFRDFVFARVLTVVGEAASDVESAADRAWHTSVQLVLAPHPELTAGQRRVIELDYGMKDGRLIVRTRRALLFYLLQHLGLNPEPRTTPQEKQVVLLNEDEIIALLGAHESSQQPPATP